MLNEGKRKQAFALLKNNRLQEASELFEKACAINRNDLESWKLLVSINAQLGRPTEVEKCCQEIIRLVPNSYEAYFHLGSALMLQGKRVEAIDTFRKVLRLKPDYVPAYINLGHLSENLDEALEHYSRAATLAPSLAETHGALGTALVACGKIDEAITSFQRSLRIRPDTHVICSNMLLTLNYSTSHDPGAIFAEHARWGKAQVRFPPRGHANSPEPDRTLRVGYVSPDFREHSVAYFFEPILGNHDPREVETYCYADVARPDATTQRLQSLAAHWQFTASMNDRDLAERIRSDRIDILVDLAGHSAGNRLLLFATKPAPIQVTYLGYPNTTGLTTMDYRLTDAWADPPGTTDRYYTEKLVRLPRGFSCYLPPSDRPPVAEAPVMKRGYVTFGSFNNLPKISPAVVSLWASILHAVPDSRLLLKNYSFSASVNKERHRQLFADNGIGPERIEFRGRDQTMMEHLGSYAEIDIALDTFPYNGATTTCEAMLMGVPVVTLAGRSHAGRVGISLLEQAGCADLVAETPEEYVRKASALAGNHEELARKRISLREQMLNSALCDGKTSTRDIEAAYRDMWRQWCQVRT